MCVVWCHGNDSIAVILECYYNLWPYCISVHPRQYLCWNVLVLPVARSLQHAIECYFKAIYSYAQIMIDTHSSEWVLFGLDSVVLFPCITHVESRKIATVNWIYEFGRTVSAPAKRFIVWKRFAIQKQNERIRFIIALFTSHVQSRQSGSSKI